MHGLHHHLVRFSWEGRKLGIAQGEMISSDSDTRAYALQISGTLDADFLVSFCPPGARTAIHDEHVVLLNLRTDQADILGIIRQLHNFSCILFALETKFDDL